MDLRKLKTLIDLVAEFGTLPESVYVAAVAYATSDAGGINSQAPSGNGNNNLEPAEFLRIPVAAVARSPAQSRIPSFSVRGVTFHKSGCSVPADAGEPANEEYAPSLTAIAADSATAAK
jgi:hypothetical protein